MGSSKVAVWAALIGNSFIAIAKLIGGVIANSAAMFAEAAHSFSDVGNQVLLLIGINRSDAPPSEKHPFGTGKSAYFWPFLVAVLLFGVAGGYSLFEGIEKVLHPHPVDDIRVALGVLALAFVIESGSLYVAFREAQKGAREASAKNARAFVRMNRDASLLTVLVEDALALVGLPIAALGLILAKSTGNGIYDGAASILIGVILMGFAVFLAREVHDMLIGERLRLRDLQRVKDLAVADPDVIRLEAVKSMHLGPETALLGAEVILRAGLSSDRAAIVLERLEAAIREAVPVLKHVYLQPAVETAATP